MKKTSVIVILIILLGISPTLLVAQVLFAPGLHNIWQQVYGKAYTKGSGVHTSLRPWFNPDIIKAVPVDSAFNDEKITISSTSIFGKLCNNIFNESLITVRSKDFGLTIDPLFDFSIGRDHDNRIDTYINTRGVLLEGNIGNNLSFSTRFYETQGRYPAWISDFANKYYVLPGQGAFKEFKNDAYDFDRSEAYLSFSPSIYINLKLGYGKNFIGDGYRSLLLSDNSFSYPFLKATANIWRLQYTALYTEFQNRHMPLINSNIGSVFGNGHPRKYGTFHYLDFTVTKRLNIAFFEGVLWSRGDSTYTRGFDFNYLNPVLFLRPVEHTIYGSPDNSFMGTNMSFRFGNSAVLFGQFFLDEFKLSHMIKNDGWAGNKYAYQIGIKSYKLFNITNLYGLLEYDRACPYTYSHLKVNTNYSHYYQPLAHPLGANFWEINTQTSYRYKRWYIELLYSYAIYGKDEAGENNGGDIFQSYLTANKEYDNYVGQGIKTSRKYFDIKFSWLVNFKTNMNISIGATNWNISNIHEASQTTWFYAALQTSLDNFYYDF